MTIMCDTTIEGLCVNRTRPMIFPFEPRTVHEESGLTFGIGPSSYDVRLDQDITLMPGRFALGSTMEEFKMPDMVTGSVKDKSSLSRLGLMVFNTHIDPGWQGFLTLELHNLGNQIFYFEKGQPIAQIVFHLMDHPAARPYSGKYQNQESGPQESRRG